MKDKNKTKTQLIEELTKLRQQAARRRELEGGSAARIRYEIRQQVRQRLRDQVAKMRHSDEIQHVLSVLKEGLHELEISFHNCGINLVDSRRTPTVRITSLGDEGEEKELLETWAHDLIFQFWQAGVPVYRRDLQTEDIYGEHRGQLEHFRYPVRCILDIPFAYGTLAINSVEPDAFSPEDIADLEQLSVVLEEGFRRWKDLQGLEQRNGELEKEIGERRLAEKHLETIEERYRKLFEEAPTMYIITKNQEMAPFITDVNTKFLSTLGYARHEVIGRPLADFYTPESNARLSEGGYQQALGGRFLPQERQLVARDGRVIETLLHASPEIGLDKENVGTRGIFVDITGSKQAERVTQINLSLQRVRNEILLMENEEGWELVVRRLDEELREWIDCSACGINILDRSTNTQVSYAAIPGAGVRRYQLNDIHPLLLRVVETGVPLYRRTRVEIERFPSHGTGEARSVVDMPIHEGTLVVSSTQENAFDEQDIELLKPFAQVMAEGARRLKDLTELAKRKQQLHQSQKMQAIGELTAGIAHNFNNKLMVILSSIEMAMLKGQDDSRELQAAERSTLQAAEMIEQLMVFSRSEGVAKPKSIQIQKILSDTMAIGRKTFDRKITLVDEVSGNLPLVSGDSTQLDQVFLNLLLNARDAVEERNATSPSIHIEANTVSIEKENLPADLLSHQSDYIRVNITDDGIGMNEETQQRIFEPFFTTKDVDKGTGLGMATAYAAIKDHQGWIEFESQVGVGTTFSVYLPVAKQEIIASAVEPSQAMPRGTETILCIEDEEDLRNQLVALLKQYGYEVLVGKDGQEGWEAFEREYEHVDVVLLDLSLPNVSGQEVLLRMLTLNPDVKIIVSTGYVQRGAEVSGAKEILKKPYRLSQVLQTIREVLDE